MEYMQLSDSKSILFIILVAFVGFNCKSSEPIQENTQPTFQTIPDLGNTDQQEKRDESGENKATPVIVTYRNASSAIQVTLDPNKDEFYLDLKGMTPTEKDSIIVVDSSLVNNRARDIQTLLSSYRKAQDLFYLGEYNDALAEVERTIRIQETADAYALKGTIFFMMENITAARANWNKAVQMDPNIPVPSIPELETLINELREDGGQ
jgi:tetratricopeptide (TPR) repeat protein